jgi:PhnB protein
MAIAVEPALSPHLVVDDAAAAIDFYVKAFGAVEIGRVPAPTASWSTPQCASTASW